MEQWKIIDEYPKYSVSTFGRVKNNVSGKILSQSINNWGYCRVAIYADNKKRQLSVHRAVATAFIPNDNPERIQVNHIDCDKQNNSVQNLEWVTPVENMTHAYKNNLVPTYHDKAIVMLDKDYQILQQFKSATDASLQVSGIKGNQGNISRSAQSNGEKLALGYRWMYID
jgi:hypothetical protein